MVSVNLGHRLNGLEMPVSAYLLCTDNIDPASQRFKQTAVTLSDRPVADYQAFYLLRTDIFFLDYVNCFTAFLYSSHCPISI